jgi:Plant transposon protein
MLGHAVAASYIQYLAQMGESILLLAFNMFVDIIANDDEFKAMYLRSMTRFDSDRVLALRYKKHCEHSMMGLLNCTHVEWQVCPTKDHGTYVAHKATPIIVFEAVTA